MIKIIVFGATGDTGSEVVKQGLEKGYQITAIVRTPSEFDLKHKHLKVMKGDVLQPTTFEKEISGNDAVISCLGNGSSTKPTTVYSIGTKNIISAMNNAGVKRLICMSAKDLDADKEMGFFRRIFIKQIFQKIMKETFSDMRLMEKEVEASNIDWTIMMPPRLKNKPRTGKYRIAVNSYLTHSETIARADVAAYMLSIIKSRKTFKSKVDIAY
ncbi:MAG: SDR family oxidoreductase [Ginsengibacter sp.]